MSLKIVEKDIFEIETDCIVNPTDNYLSGSGSIDARIHQAGGKQLYDYLAKKEMTRYDEADIVSTPVFPTSKRKKKTIPRRQKSNPHHAIVRLPSTQSECF